MKRLLSAIILSFCWIAAMAQTPAGMSYQAVVRNADGSIIASRDVKFRISILENSETGTPVYVETHSEQTNAFGLVNLVIGSGTVLSGAFSPTGWGGAAHYLKVEIDPSNGGSFFHFGTTQLLTVPYAFHSQTVEEDKVDDADADPANEIQALQLSGMVLTLSKGGGSVTLPIASSYTETDPVFNVWDKSTGISITESQISDLGIYLETETDPDFNASPAASITNAGSGAVITTAERTKLTSLDVNAEQNVQADWNETGNTSDAYIQNKPTIPVKTSELTNDAGFIISETDPAFGAWDKTTGISVTESQISDLGTYLETETDPDFNASPAASITNAGSGAVITTAERTKLTSLDVNAEQNVQADWNETGNTSDAYIQNKPTIPAKTSELTNDAGFIISETDPVFGAWDKSTGISITESQVSDLGNYVETETDPDFNASPAASITNAGSGVVITSAERTKLTSLDANAEQNVQANWNETDNTSDAYIQNKPAIPGKTSDLTNDAGFIISETDPAFTNWDKTTGISITKSQVTDFPANATTTTDGLMSAADKTKLEGLQNTDGSETKLTAGANVIITGNGTLGNPYLISASAMEIGQNTGDMMYWDGSSWVVLPVGAQGQVLKLNTSNVPEWQDLSAGSAQAPAVTTLAATNVNQTDATLNGSVNPNGFITTVEFEWGSTTAYGNTVTAVQSPVTGTSAQNVSAAISGLQSSATYYYRVKAANAVDEAAGNQGFFITGVSVPVLTTTAISSITGITAESGGDITYDGGSPVTARGVCWSTSPNPTTVDDKSMNGPGAGTFTATLKNLNLGTTYYVRAYASNANGTAYGNEISFKTINIPTLTTANVSTVKGNLAYSGGSITNSGGQTATVRGLCWATHSNPTTDDNITTTLSSSTAMPDLTPNTVYYVRAYATNSAGTGYGNEVSFNSGYIFGTLHAGGLVFYNDGAGHGLVCAESDQGTFKWGCYGTSIAGTGTALGTGEANTTAIVTACTESDIAAKICYDLELNSYTDWYLPSQKELYWMYYNLQRDGLGGFATGTDRYWSSSEYASTSSPGGSAYNYNFNNGSTGPGIKAFTNYVRAVRDF